MRFRRVWRALVNRVLAQGATAARPRRQRLQLEALEDRVVPTTWFVSTAGVDASGRGGQTTPFRNIQFAVNQAQSGDTINVATGIYGYDAASTNAEAAFLRISAVVLDADKSLSFLGGFNTAFTARSASTPTVIDGGGVRRDMLVLAANAGISMSMDMFTLQNGAAHGEPLLTGLDQTFAFGGGMWINTAAQQAGSGPFNLSNITFLNDSATGNSGGTQGGNGAGGGLELRHANNVNLTNVIFNGDVAQGGTGSTAGGGGLGGALQADHSSVTGSNITFNGNRAQAASSAGTGNGPNGTADALGGAAAIMIASSANFSGVTATSNQAVAGVSSGQGGAGFGGAFYGEDAAITLADSNITANTVVSGNGGTTGGNAVGGGIAVFNSDGTLTSNLTLNRVKVVSNTAQSGSGATAGSAGGGGVYVTVTAGSGAAVFTNTLIADNKANLGSGGANAGGGGGGVWLQGLTATITYSTIANNQLGANLIFGSALLLLNNGVPQPTVANVSFTIIANNSGPTSATTAVAALPSDAAGRDTVNYKTSLYANNQTNDNSATVPGAYTGLSSVLGVSTAGFVSPGAPNEDYRLLSTSAAVGSAGAPTVPVDLNNFARVNPTALGAYELGSIPSSPPPPSPPPPSPPAVPARTSPGVFDPSTGIWYLRNENSAGGPDAGQFAYGAPGWIPVVGDWTGQGKETIGVFDPNTATWYLKNSNSAGAPNLQFQYGAPGWKPVVGDWDGNGTWTVGVVDPSGVWYLRNENSAGAPDVATPFAYGLGAWTPVAGEWNGGTKAGIGMFDPSTGIWYLRNETTAGAPDAGQFAYGGVGWRPIVGDWDNNGTVTVGVFDPTGTWYLRNSNSGGAPDVAPFAYGVGSWIPVAGDYDGLPAQQAALILGDPLSGTPPRDALDAVFGQL